MSPGTGAVDNMKRLRDLPLHRWVLAAIVLLALALRYEGVDRPLSMHPDERVIVEWMEVTRATGWLKGETYAGGFFVMAETARRVFEATVFEPWQRLLYHAGSIDRPERYLSPAAFGRHFNVWLGALTVLPIYFLCLRVSGARGAALLGAALFAYAAYHVEHSHYLESDVAMVATLALALWLGARFAEKPGWGRFAAVALVSGYAAGTKYTLVLLLALLLPFGLRRFAAAAGERPWQVSGRAALRVLVGLLLAALGFIVATRAALKFSWFLAELRQHGDRTFNETAGILGDAWQEPWVKQIHHLRELWHYLGSLGPGWLLLALAGLPLLLLRERRRHWPVTLLFPGMYLCYFIFAAPFVRTQEFMNLLPALAISASAAAAWLLARAEGAGGSAAQRAGAYALLLCLLLPSVRMGALAASRCGWADTRHLARQWLAKHLPYEVDIAAERYTSPATAEISRSETAVNKVEAGTLPAAIEGGSLFLVRNPSAGGRGFFDPRSGAPYPRGQAALEAFIAASERLRVWSVINPEQPRVTFRSPRLELWSLRPPAPGPDLRIQLPQPMAVSEAGRETFFPVGRALGAADGVPIDRDGREIAIGGPDVPARPLYVVFNTLERPAQVRVRGLGRSRGADLQPYDAAAIILRRPWWLPRFSTVERIRARTLPQRYITYVPCWLRIAFDATEAARLLADLGRPDRAWELLEAHGGGDDPGLAFRVALAAGRTSEALSLRAAALAQLESVEKALRGETPPWRLNGVSAARYDDFARLRIGRREQSSLLTLHAKEDPGPTGSPGPFEAPLPAPLLLAGPWTMTLEVRAGGAGSRPGEDAPLELLDESGRPLFAGSWGTLGGAPFHPLIVEMDGAARERPIDLHWTSPIPGVLDVKNIEVRWRLADTLRAWSRGQRIALARLALARRALPEARATRATLLAAGAADFDVEERRLDFEMAQAGGDAAEVERAARRLLERAPEHFGALRALAGADQRCAREANRREAAAGETVVFEPLVAIRRAEVADKRLRLVIEALHDSTPPLAAQVHERRMYRWASKTRVALSPKRALHAGERVVVELPLGGIDPSRLGVSIIADVPYVPGKLPARGEEVIGLADLPGGGADTAAARR